MKSYWISPENKNRAYYNRYAAVFKTLLPENADIITVTDDNEKVCGFSALETDLRFAEVLFFYVMDNEREKGYGTFMLQEIMNSLKGANVGMIRCIMPRYDGYEELFTKAGFDMFEGEHEYVFTFGALHYSDLYVKTIAGKNTNSAKSVSECSPDEVRILGKFFKENDIPQEGLDRQLSVASFTDGALDAIVLCEKKKEGVMVDYLHNYRTNLQCIRDCFRKIDEVISAYGDKANATKIFISTDNYKNKGLAKTLVGDYVQMEEIVRETVAVKNVIEL